MAASFFNVNSPAGLKKLDEYLLSHSYITGYQASKDDITVHAALSKPPSSEYVNAFRWYNHIAALLRISCWSFFYAFGVEDVYDEDRASENYHVTPWTVSISSDNNLVAKTKILGKDSVSHNPIDRVQPTEANHPSQSKRTKTVYKTSVLSKTVLSFWSSSL